MSHEGRMMRGQEKISKGITDSETAYFLEHKPAPVNVDKVEEKKPKTKEAKNAKPTK